MNRFDTYSIKWRLFGYLVLFIAIPVALLWFFQIAFLEQFYTRIKVNDVEDAAATIVDNIENEDIGSLIDRVAHANDVSIGVYESDGTPLYSSSFGPESGVPMDTQSVVQYYLDAQANNGSLLQYFMKPPIPDLEYPEFVGKFPPHSQRMGKSIAYARLVSTTDGQQKLVLVNTVITPVDATVRTLRAQLIYTTLILLILSLFLAVLMSRRISRPIIKTTAAAKQLAKGNYHTVFEAHGYSEIVELSKTLNFAASEMSKVERLRQELISNVSHDLRTPLTMITGYSEMMRDIPGENTPENVQIIIDEASRLSQLVSDMLDISQLQSGGQAVKLGCCNLTQSIRDVMERYARLTVQDGYHIRFYAEEDVYVNCDLGRMMQVVYNLINNAINYTGEDKRVEVRQAADENHVRIEVMDTGDGINEKDIPYIWDRYYKVDKTHKRATIGTGLGLSIVRSVLDLHDATYGVESTVGKGSVFWFQLSRCQPANGKYS